MATILQVVAAMATPFLFYWLGRGTVKGRWCVFLWVLAVCVALTVIGVSVYQYWQRVTLANALSNQVVSGNDLLGVIPKGCPKGVDVKEWEGKVEAWKTETARWLGQAFADDQNNYEHRCPLEAVRNRLVYFKGKLNTAVLILQAGR